MHTVSPQQKKDMSESNTQSEHAVEFIPDSHTYLIDGQIVPSATQIICHFPQFRDMYKNVPAGRLKRKADYGNVVHALIESVGLQGGVSPDFNWKSHEGLALDRWMKLSLRHDIHLKSAEQIVYYMEDMHPLYIGTYDLQGTVEGKNSLIDIKTTSKYHPDYLSYQLSMYALAYEQMTHETIESLWCYWCPKKGLGRMVEVEMQDRESLLAKIKAYKRP